MSPVDPLLQSQWYKRNASRLPSEKPQDAAVPESARESIDSPTKCCFFLEFWIVTLSSLNIFCEMSRCKNAMPGSV